MQIQVMSEQSSGHAVDAISVVIAGLKRTAHGYPVVHADAYAAGGLLEILEIRAARGERELMVLGSKSRRCWNGSPRRKTCSIWKTL